MKLGWENDLQYRDITLKLWVYFQQLTDQYYWHTVLHCLEMNSFFSILDFMPLSRELNTWKTPHRKFGST